jgi:hypothetical protein
MARTSFSGPVYSEAGFISGSSGGTTTLPSYTVTTLPPVTPAGQLIYVSNAAGTPTICYSNGTNWLRADTAAIVT